MATEDYYIQQRVDLYPHIPNNIKKTLDVGCATGIFSEWLKNNRDDIETWGIEMDKESALKAETRLDRFLLGSFDDVFEQLPKGYFDCIFFNDVLEHMPDPESCLRKIKECLAPDGVIMASIPNVRHVSVLRELLFAKDWKYKESGILDKTHLRFFTRKSIVRLFTTCGYSIYSIKGINKVKPFSLTAILNALTFNSLSDVRFVQYLTIAHIKK